MNKDQLAQELRQKLKLGIKPSDLKKKPQEKNSQIPTPPDSPIIEPIDQKISQKLSKKSQTSSPTEIKKIKQLEEQVNYWSQIAQNYLTNLQQTTAELDQAQARIKELEWVLKQKPEPETVSQVAEEALMEANQKIRELQEKNEKLIKTIQDLKKPIKPTGELQPQETKTFLCSDCQQSKLHTELSRVFGKHSFCLECSKKARQTAQQEKTEPQPQDFICHSCQQTKSETPAKMKLDQTLQTYLICSSCRPTLKEFNEADLITDELWAKYPYSSASEILEKEFNLKKEEPW